MQFCFLLLGFFARSSLLTDARPELGVPDDFLPSCEPELVVCPYSVTHPGFMAIARLWKAGKKDLGLTCSVYHYCNGLISSATVILFAYLSVWLYSFYAFAIK